MKQIITGNTDYNIFLSIMNTPGPELFEIVLDRIHIEIYCLR